MTDYFDKCPRCGDKSGSWTQLNIYECEKCDEIFCYHCLEGSRCPACGSKDYTEIGFARQG